LAFSIRRFLASGFHRGRGALLSYAGMGTGCTARTSKLAEDIHETITRLPVAVMLAKGKQKLSKAPCRLYAVDDAVVWKP
jgi:hypothetical protein